MSKHICPECGCVYENDRFECIDCGKHLLAVNDEDLAAFEHKREKSLASQSDKSESRTPSRWQIIATVTLAAYSLALLLLAGFAERVWLVAAINVIFAAFALIPQPRLTVRKSLDGQRKRSFVFAYRKIRILIALCAVAAYNLFFLIVYIGELAAVRAG